MSINDAIKRLANRGYNPKYWLHDQDINGAWYGSVGASCALFGQPGGFRFMDRFIPSDEQDAINVMLGNHK